MNNVNNGFIKKGNVEILSKDGKIFLVNRQFSIVESGDTIDEAFARFDAAKNKIMQTYKSLGIEFEEDEEKTNKIKAYNFFKIYLVMASIIIPFVLLIGFTITLKKASNVIAITKKEVATYLKDVSATGNIADVFIASVDKLDSISDERKYELQASMQKLSQFFKPMMAASQHEVITNDNESKG